MVASYHCMGQFITQSVKLCWDEAESVCGLLHPGCESIYFNRVLESAKS